MDKKRIFTEETEAQLIKLADTAQTHCISQNAKITEILIIIKSILIPNTASIFTICNFSQIKEWLNSAINNAEFNVSTLDIKKSEIKKAFKNVRLEDTRVGKNIENLAAYSAEYKNLISEFEFVMNKKNKSFNPEAINSDLKNALNSFNNFKQNKYKKYVDLNDAYTFTDESYYIGDKYLGALNIFTAILMAWKSRNKILASYIKDLWNLIIDNKSVSWDAYNESKIKAAIKSTLDAYAEQDSNDFTKYTKKADEYISLIKNCKTLAEFKKSKTFTKDKNLKKLIEKMGGFEKVWKAAKECPELLEYLFSDYEKQKEAFALIKETYKDDPDYFRIVDQLENEYNNKLYGVAERVLNIAFDEFAKNGTASAVQIMEWAISDILGKAFTGGAGGLFSAITAGIDIAVYISGGGTWADNALDFCYYQQNSKMYNEIYNRYREKILSGKYTQKDIDRMKMAFQMMKQNLLKEYKCYLNMCKDPSEKAEIQKRIIEIENMEPPIVQNCNGRGFR